MDTVVRDMVVYGSLIVDQYENIFKAKSQTRLLLVTDEELFILYYYVIKRVLILLSLNFIIKN